MTHEDTQTILSDSDRSLHEIYFELQKHYEHIYGADTVVLMEVGSFFEIYGIDNDEEKIGKPKEIGDLLNLQLTRKNKTIPENHIKNPLLVGFPTATFDRYIRRIIAEKKYTIIIVRQKGEPPHIERYVDRILSPGIHADYTLDHQANFVSSIILEEDDGRYTAGFAALDVSTGASYIAEMYSTKEDPTFALDELFRHLQAHPTSELVMTLDSASMKIEELKNYLDLDGTHIQTTKKRLNLNYQNALFSNIYSIQSFLSPVEFLDLERKRFASEAMASLIEFIISHDYDVIKELQKPTILENETFVYLGNNPLEQLDITSRDPHKETVLGVMDKTVTSIGRRLLFERVMNPIMNKATLEARYDLSDSIEPVYAKVDTHLRSVYDLERIVRRIRTGRLHPLEINFLYDSLVSAREIDETLNAEATNLHEKRDAIDALIVYIEKTINLDISTTCMQQEIKESFFLPGVDAELDDLLAKIATESAKLEAVKTVIAELLTEKLGNDASEYVDIKKLDKEGHYLHLTKNRYALIADVLKKQFVSIDGTVHAFTNFSYKLQTTNVKITGPIIDTISEAITVLESRLVARVKERFAEMIIMLDRDYAHHISEISNTLATIDVALSNVKCTRAYKLVRPDIVEQDEPMLEIKTLRHPLIELREQHGIYVPNDVNFGISEKKEVWEEHTRGILLYGINSSGKSSLMKSIGIAVVLAQSGCYVPAKNMRFTLVKELFTRIVSRDNITQGLSSFAVEMMELKNIFNRATTHSIILGDEISHGTETLSAIAIIAAALGQLHDIGALFFFTTHLHQLQSLPHVANMDHIQSLHLAVHYDEATDTLIFDRTLQQGSGSSIYGLEFAQSLHMNATFLTNAMNIRRELAGELKDTELLLKKQTSKYNDTLYLTRCAVCGANVEDTHHIKEQHTADDTDHIEHFHKDHKYNLIPLCKECHIKVHQGKLKINGFFKTSKGFALDIEEEK
ncbi:MAG: DNA mismatch repair protein [Candidatus Magasanikbacteria bacterium CG10_big_fil_rev_8_21_14_0_10_42_10]|uniref:DNA mismatch repair protein n=2 Tax=Candidatus Magasanikiibacteriota TaxID=1752731 RepID=A0A2H0TVW9_9BACT|nr:MAG: DNA mismatch repair protein [Candidatus Magasanikbacteria bacterium CG10_big_fil_rev_8_21_14_0_10_42_10]PIZ92856.1 MAG: DNA mismatch repair protein [Candidatus Magasanikbacteria bacterium CG_4_10_14_0_2_um_filter_41_10]